MSNDKPQIKRNDVYEQVTNTIIKQLEKGVVPWKQNWKGNATALTMPKNASTGINYRGINILLLWCASIEQMFSSSEWGTFKQWQEKKETVRKGERGSMIVYFDKLEKEVDGELKEIPYLKCSKVFNRCQLASFTTISGEKPEYHDFYDRLQPVEDFIGNLGATIKKFDCVPSYHPSTDVIYMPCEGLFYDTANCPAVDGYYSTLFHELVHWTGHKSRLNRELHTKHNKKGYAYEELVAELGAAFLSSEFELATVDSGDHASYIDHWLTVLKENKHCLLTIAGEASKAIKYMKGLDQPI